MFNIDSLENDAYSSKSSRKGLGPIGRIEYHNPINHYWQLAISTELGYLFSKYTRGEENDDGDYPVDLKNKELYNNINVSLGYYPDSRTSLMLSSELSTAFYTNENDSKTYSLQVKSDLEGNYYISPRLRFRGSISYAYYYRGNQSKIKDTLVQYNLAIVYKVF